MIAKIICDALLVLTYESLYVEPILHHPNRESTLNRSILPHACPGLPALPVPEAMRSKQKEVRSPSQGQAVARPLGVLGWWRSRRRLVARAMTNEM